MIIGVKRGCDGKKKWLLTGWKSCMNFCLVERMSVSDAKRAAFLSGNGGEENRDECTHRDKPDIR